MQNMKISEIFGGLQGEGVYTGVPMLFIRVYGCTRNEKTCPFNCDTLYAVKEGKYTELNIEEIKEIIEDSDKKVICFTGGEPLLYKEEIFKLISSLPEYIFHLETNGDLLTKELERKLLDYFNFIVISPKEINPAKRGYEFKEYADYLDEEKRVRVSIKIVTDLKKVGKEMLKYATSLMPLTTFNEKKDLLIKRKVWNYCMEHNLRYSPRLQVDLWGKERKK